MCSVNAVRPLRIGCEGLSSAGRPHGPASMSTNVSSHRLAHSVDMDLAWQELMAITELQEFAVPNENPYEAIPYLSVEPVASQAGFGMSQTQPEPHPNASHAVYDNTYPEMMPPYQRVPVHADMWASRMEQMNATTRGIGNAKHGHTQPDDMESDSGLSLGSSPPLASPENAIPSYASADANIGFGQSEIDSVGDPCCMRTATLGNADFQQAYGSYPASHFPVNMQHMSQQTYHTMPSGLPTALHDLHINTSGLSRMSSYPNPYPKPKFNGVPAPLSRDERRALALKIPFSLEKIVNLPVDDFNELLTQFTLNDAQLALVRDIRRRGKNKVAAQNCRKRKLENIVHLESELGQLRSQKEHLSRERLEFQQNLAVVKCRLSDLYTQVFSQLRDEEGRPYSGDEYSLQQTNDGHVYLVPRSAALEGH